MSRPIIKLRLDLAGFDEEEFLPILRRCEKDGISFVTMEQLGDTRANRYALYELNKLCSKDIPGRGPFFDYPEFVRRRFGNSYDPSGVILALHEPRWVGLSATSNWSQKDFAFNEMTGVVRDYRRRGIALALKLYGIRYARGLGVSKICTFHDFENVAAIEMNRRLGYVDDNLDGASSHLT